MAQRSLRFGIGAADGPRAATWKLWTETARGNSDVYLACRSLGGFLKASLHQSGTWHVAYSKQAFEESVQGVAPYPKDRFIEKWPKPAEIGPGVTLAFRIVTPFSAVTEADRGLDNSGVMWLPNAPEGKATEIRHPLCQSHQFGCGLAGTPLDGHFTYRLRTPQQRCYGLGRPLGCGHT